MKLLYLSPRSTKTDSITDPDGEFPYDFDSISKSIIEGISKEFSEIEITLFKDLIDNTPEAYHNDIGNYDLYICDFTTCNPNVTYFAGLIEGIGKPVIYFRSSKSSWLASTTHKNILQYSDETLKNEFIKTLNKTLKIAISDPQNFVIAKTQKTSTPKVFISYSHKDKDYLDRLMVHLKPLSKQGVIDIWVDTRLKTGDKWKDDIENALIESNIAILMISADFMASDFIINNELPPLLLQAEVKGTKILPVIISPCRFDRESSLNVFQAANSPSEPLSSMDNVKKEFIYDQMAHQIEKSFE